MRIRMKCLRRFPHLSFEPVHCKEHYSCARSMFLFFSGLMLHMGRECVFVCQQMACAVKHSSKLHTSYELSTEGSCIQMKMYCQSSTTTIWNRRLCARSECTEHLLLMAFHKHKLFDSFQRLTFNQSILLCFFNSFNARTNNVIMNFNISIMNERFMVYRFKGTRCIFEEYVNNYIDNRIISFPQKKNIKMNEEVRAREPRVI